MANANRAHDRISLARTPLNRAGRAALPDRLAEAAGGTTPDVRFTLVCGLGASCLAARYFVPRLVISTFPTRWAGTTVQTAPL